jgi:TetR/AcrR family transcriptional regulator
VRRGIEGGEFRAVDVNSVVHALTAPAKFLIIYRHCTAACTNIPAPIEPETFMDTQLDLLFKGLQVAPA